MENNHIILRTNMVITILSGTAMFLLTFSLFCQVLKFRFAFDISFFQPLFDVSLEQNLPTFFSVLLMLLNSLLLGIIAALSFREGGAHRSKWVILSVGFLYMAYDEGFHVHEDLVAVIRPLLGDGRLGVFYYAWVIPGLMVVCILFFFFLRFLLFLNRRSRILFLLAAVTYLGGCIGMEMVGGYYDELYGAQNLKYNFLSTMEEGLEMAGLILFLYGLLDYLSTYSGGVRLKIV